uniref:Apolipoprotein(A)-like isoform X1 n=1 Tax=Crassostrea virginica TaxID=6565 RepID=A0A8B8CGW1_CRAVI|nr:apolipoprotein(a)-like isoform X1 [Crassostrea virginica]
MEETLICCTIIHLIIITGTSVITYPNCKLTREGMEYRGNISVTTSGRTCQRWDRQEPHAQGYGSHLPGNASLHENFCRNPLANEDATPWCYTTDPNVRYELCDIPACGKTICFGIDLINGETPYIVFSECRDTLHGETYIGLKSHTVTGKQCLRWDSVNSSNPDYAAIRNLKGSISDHENYCRNPDRKTSPWCFIQTDSDQWEYCDIPFCKRGNEECLSNPSGLNYFGTVSRTTDNIECQRWDEQKPHKHVFSTEFMGLPVSKHNNYCRNPDSRERPWCYTVDSTVPFQYCDIPKCQERNCKITDNGIEYKGKHNMTRNGIPCQRWDSTFPHVPSNKLSFPGETFSAQENYCRNPDGESSPWCYTVDPSERWDYCYIPNCSKKITYPNCKLTRLGMEYRGNISITTSGKTCQRWDSQSPHSHDYGNDLPLGASIHENYCRSPDSEDAITPWCYTTDANVRWEYCDIPICECRDTLKGEGYIGSTAHTINGTRCLRWDSLNRSNSKYASILKLKGNITSHENYCRNPDEKLAPWCYIRVDNGLWEYCDIPFCKQNSAECLNNPRGQEYLGTETNTEDNIECQRWDEQKPHSHELSRGFMGLPAPEHANYCRNPDNRDRPWCYTVNSTVLFQYCNIRECQEHDCKDTEVGLEYRGIINMTRNGIPCQRWDSKYPHEPSSKLSFPSESLSAHENYCRNPDKKLIPWCYTVDPDVRWDYCDVPFCLSDSDDRR